jgi:hypothetical protein
LLPHSSRSHHELEIAGGVSLLIASKIVMIAPLSSPQFVQWKAVSFSLR